MKDSTTLNILEKWASYSNWSEDQTSFNLLSDDYTLHSANKLLKQINSEFDPSGVIGVLYAKQIFLNLLDTKTIKLRSLVAPPPELERTIDMWNTFNSSEVSDIEETFFQSIDKIVRQTSQSNYLGSNLSVNRDTILSAIETVGHDLLKCKVNVFAKGGPVMQINHVSSYIQVFDTLAACLLMVERSSDGLYLCYISANDSAAGYFGFYLKSNGNLIEITERVDEVYVGQFQKCRNARYSDDKLYELFPYDELISFGGYDSTGTATTHTIDRSRLQIANLSAKSYFPIILSILFIIHKYTGCEINSELSYVNTLLPINCNSKNTATANIIPVGDSAIRATHADLNIDISAEDISTGALSREFDRNTNGNGSIYDSGEFPGNSHLADVWGINFDTDVSTLLASDVGQHIAIGDVTTRCPALEYVGSAKRMRMQAYLAGRTRLAEHIRNQMLEEYESCGGSHYIADWYNLAISAKKDDLLKLFISHYFEDAGQTIEGLDSILDTTWKSRVASIISIEKDVNMPSNVHSDNICNTSNSDPRWSARKYMCPITGATATIFCIFRPRDWNDLKVLFDSNDIPKILEGWRKDGHSPDCNPLITACDPISSVGTIVESQESRRYAHVLNSYPRFVSEFAIGLSKQGITHLKKMYEEMAKSL